MDLIEAENIKKRWQNTQKNYTKKILMTQIFTLLKDLWDPDNHNGMITHLAPDILGCKVKWA